MWPNLLQEVRTLRARYTGKEPGLDSLGYREALAVVGGAMAADEGYQRFVRSTLAYAKRQRTWFRNQLRAETVTGGTTEEMAQQVFRALSRPDA
jgi:tRNA dimethylallyltransferase